MFSLLGYTFFQNALIAGVLASIACGIIGTFVIIRRMVAISGGISHAAFGGIGLGYFLGIEPLLGALGFTVGAALTMGELEQRAEQHMDTLIGAVWATGMALSWLLLITLFKPWAEAGWGYRPQIEAMARHLPANACLRADVDPAMTTLLRLRLTDRYRTQGECDWWLVAGTREDFAAESWPVAAVWTGFRPRDRSRYYALIHVAVAPVATAASDGSIAAPIQQP